MITVFSLLLLFFFSFVSSFVSDLHRGRRLQSLMRQNCTGCLKEPCNLEFLVWCSRCYFMSYCSSFRLWFYMCIVSGKVFQSCSSECSASSLVICWGCGNMDKEERVGARLHTKVEISFLYVEDQPRNYLSFGECFLLYRKN